MVSVAVAQQRDNTDLKAADLEFLTVVDSAVSVGDRKMASALDCPAH